MSCDCDRIESFCFWDEEGRCETWEEWLQEINTGEEKAFGKTVRYTWRACGRSYGMANPDPETGALVLLEPLPDWSGLIALYSIDTPDNVVLLDACGGVRKRLRVPWEMVRDCRAEGATFIGVLRRGCYNRAEGRWGKFALKADIYWSDGWGSNYCFELDWRTGEFLWWHEQR